MSLTFHSLRIVNKVQETEDTVSLHLEIPHSLASGMQYLPGQYVNVRIMLDGQEERRAYSLSSSPIESDFVITVKKVNGGKVSNYMHDHLNRGDTLDVSMPEGRFIAEPHPEEKRTHILYAAGSGITPILSIIKTILEQEPKSLIYLLYGSRNEEQIIFKEALQRLEEHYKGQLFVEHIISKPSKSKPSGIGGWFKSGTVDWKGMIGRITPISVTEFTDKYDLNITTAEHYLCGPGNMIQKITQYLESSAVDKKKIHREYFTTVEDDASPKTGKSGLLIAHLDQEKIEVQMSTEPILKTLMDAGHEPPYSCTNGTCSACMAKLIKGQVVMDQCYALDEDEINEGYILTCQGRLASESAEITYDI